MPKYDKDKDVVHFSDKYFKTRLGIDFDLLSDAIVGQT